MTDLEGNIAARESILRSIRENLAASAPHDLVQAEGGGELSALKLNTEQRNGYQPSARAGAQDDAASSLIEIFMTSLEAVGAQGIVVKSELEASAALTRIVSGLRGTPLLPSRIALSNAPIVERLIRNIDVAVDEITIGPSAAELFGYEVGISTAQAAIAETGTLMLDSEAERHRLVSLVPPVHIAIVEASNICLTLGEALAAAGQGSEVSSTITFITGPSRTADIELTLAIGVHGPQELFVIVNEAGG